MIAVCDLDSKRKQGARDWVAKYYKDHKKKGYIDVKMYDDYREMLTTKDIDAVIVSTRDHLHAQPAMQANLAGKLVYLQKPTSITIEEGRMLSDIVHRTIGRAWWRERAGTVGVGAVGR